MQVLCCELEGMPNGSLSSAGRRRGARLRPVSVAGADDNTQRPTLFSTYIRSVRCTILCDSAFLVVPGQAVVSARLVGMVKALVSRSCSITAEGIIEMIQNTRSRVELIYHRHHTLLASHCRSYTGVRIVDTVLESNVKHCSDE